ncbi:MAG: hypothetical protein WD751_11480 [Anaerolineales bacterium]
MPAVTRWFIKSSLLYLAAALALAIWLAGQPFGLPVVPGLSPVLFHFFLVGWVTQMIMGVGYWFFPKFNLQQPRRSEPLGWAVFWLLNAGLLLRGLAEPLLSMGPGFYWVAALVSSAILQWLAGVLFVVNTWARIKER